MEEERRYKMKMRVWMHSLAVAGMMALCAGVISGCSAGGQEVKEPAAKAEAVSAAGTILLRVNPEIAVEYDESGRVTDVRGVNEDGEKIVENYKDYIGKECREVVSDLVSEIHDAGYFVEEVEGENRKITIEIEAGSVLPEKDFLENIVTDVQTYVEEAQMNSRIVLEDEKDQSDAEGYGAKAYEVDIPSADEKDTKETPEGDDPSKETPASKDDSQAAPPESDDTGNNPGAAPGSGNGSNPGAAPGSGNGSNPGTTPGSGNGSNPGTTPGSGNGGTPGTPSGGDTGNPPADTPSQPQVRQDSPYTDYESPYTNYESPDTNYESPYTNYDSHYDSDYSDYHH